jgi:dTDP-4-dehydrorhamnose 3,5-epimerase
MKFTATGIQGVWLLEMERHYDDRGWFGRTWCAEEFRARGLEDVPVQCSSSFNLRRGTLRGMHYQAAPHEEAKVVRCSRGAAFDAALDLRVHSATFCQWVSVELTPDNGLALYVPKGCAHGFQTLEDNTEILYSITEKYYPEAGRGVRWDDRRFAIKWPLPDQAILSPRDAGYPDFSF